MPGLGGRVAGDAADTPCRELYGRHSAAPRNNTAPVLRSGPIKRQAVKAYEPGMPLSRIWRRLALISEKSTRYQGASQAGRRSRLLRYCLSRPRRRIIL